MLFTAVRDEANYINDVRDKCRLNTIYIRLITNSIVEIILYSIENHLRGQHFWLLIHNFDLTL